MIRKRKQHLGGSISMIKRFIKILICILFFILLSAFSFWKLLPNGSIDKVQKETKNLNNYMNKTGSEIIRCIKEKDKERLNALFCEKVKDTNYLKQKMDIVLDYISEKNITFKNEDWESPYSHGSTGYSGKTVEWISCKCKNILIDNKEYVLNFNAYEILKGHKEYEGVLHIYFTEEIDKNKLQGRLIKNKEKGYLGIDLVNIDYDNLEWKNIVPKEIDENEQYVIPDDLEKGRSKW